jgi:hypothetical protein
MMKKENRSFWSLLITSSSSSSILLPYDSSGCEECHLIIIVRPIIVMMINICWLLIFSGV